MKILVIHEVDWLKKVVFEIHNISEQMALLGHDVTAIDYEDRWQWQGISRVLDLKTRDFGEVSRTGASASVHLRRPGFIRLPGLSRLSAGVTHYREIKRLLRDGKIDVILLYAVATSGLQTVHLAKKYRVPVVFRSIDILHRLVPYPPLRPVVRTMEKKVYRAADCILANAPRYARYVQGMGVPDARIKLVLMPVDTGLFQPGAEKPELRQRWGLSREDRIILFIGTLFNFSGLDGFLRHMPRLIARYPDVRLLIVGDGPQRRELDKLIRELSLEGRVIITGFQQYNTMPDYINMAEVCINTFANTEETADFFPSKILQYLACGKPAVATPLLGITSIVPGESHGMVYAEVDDMAENIAGLLNSPQKRGELGLRGLEYVRSTHRYEVISRRFEACLLEVIEEKRKQLNR